MHTSAAYIHLSPGQLQLLRQLHLVEFVFLFPILFISWILRVQIIKKKGILCRQHMHFTKDSSGYNSRLLLPRGSKTADILLSRDCSFQMPRIQHKLHSDCAVATRFHSDIFCRTIYRAPSTLDDLTVLNGVLTYRAAAEFVTVTSLCSSVLT